MSENVTSPPNLSVKQEIKCEKIEYYETGIKDEKFDYSQTETKPESGTFYVVKTEEPVGEPVEETVEDDILAEDGNCATSQKHDLVQHTGTHSGERPFACPEWEYSSKWKGDLKRHMMKHSVEKNI